MIIDVGLARTVIYDEINQKHVSIRGLNVDGTINAIMDYIEENQVDNDTVIYMQKTGTDKEVGMVLKDQGYRVVWLENKTWKVFLGGKSIPDIPKTTKDISSGGGISAQNLGDATDVLCSTLHLNPVTSPTEGININPPTIIPGSTPWTPCNDINPPPSIPKKKEMVDHPSHYGGKNNPYEAIKVIRAWDLNFSLGSAVKYIARAGKKDLKGDMVASTIEDLKKSVAYINEEIEALQKEYETNGYQD